MSKKKEPIELIEEEYIMHNQDEDDELYWTKEAIKALKPFQRKIYLTWLEAGSYTAAAKLFRVATPTLRKYIRSLTILITDYICKHIK